MAVALVALLFGIGAGLARTARADTPASAPIVVDVDAAAGIDAATLRAAIGYELGAIVVAPDDPIASQAHGTVTVSVDRAADALVVSYREHSAPLTRSVALPRDADAINQEAVLLAGNLARDEAADLLAHLGKNQTVAAAAPPPGTAPGDAQVFTQSDVDARDLERMRVALTPLTAGDRRARRAIVWTVEGLAVAGAAASITWEFTQPRAGWAGIVASGLLCCWVFTVASSFLPDPELDALLDYYEKDRATGRPAALVLADVEEAWVAAARDERARRRFVGWSTMVGATLGLGGGVLELAIASGGGSGAGIFYAFGGTQIGLGILAAGWGAHRVLSEGPVESALHVYGQASGRPLGDTGSLVVEPRAAFVPGGGVFGLGGSF